VVLVVSFVAFAVFVDQEAAESPDTVLWQQTLQELNAGGIGCTPPDDEVMPLSGAGGKPFATGDDYYEFGSCTLDSGGQLAIVTFDPDIDPSGGVPCLRAEGQASDRPGAARWWVHQETRDAAGALDEPQVRDPELLAEVAQILGGRVVDEC
jgi:hypothetical protein